MEKTSPSIPTIPLNELTSEILLNSFIVVGFLIITDVNDDIMNNNEIKDKIIDHMHSFFSQSIEKKMLNISKDKVVYPWLNF